MKRKVRAFVILIAGLALVIGIPVSASMGISNAGIFRKWGKILNEQYQKDEKLKNAKLAEQDAYAVGESAVVTKAELAQAIEFYNLIEKDAKTAYHKAEEYVKEREALYAAAVEAGYSVTDEEVWEYLDKLKETISQADNREAVRKVIESFNSEEDYWKYEFHVYKKNIPIEKYTQNLQEQYAKEKGKPVSTDAFQESWEEYFERVKKCLAEEQNYAVQDMERDVSSETLDVDYTRNDNGTYTCRGNIYKYKMEVSGMEGESPVTFTILTNDMGTGFEEVAYSLKRAEMSVEEPKFVILGWH